MLKNLRDRPARTTTEEAPNSKKVVDLLYVFFAFVLSFTSLPNSTKFEPLINVIQTPLGLLSTASSSYGVSLPAHSYPARRGGPGCQPFFPLFFRAQPRALSLGVCPHPSRPGENM